MRQTRPNADSNPGFPEGIASFVINSRLCFAIAPPVCRLGLAEVIPWDGLWGIRG